MYNLFLDDVRTPESTYFYAKRDMYLKRSWEIVRSYDQFVEKITKQGLPQTISFDHDLAEPHYHESMFKDGKVYMKYLETVSEKTGMDCAKWLVEYCMDSKLKLPNFVVHSMNPVGGKNINMLLENFKKYGEGQSV